MKVAGSTVLHATPERVWAAITDPTVLGGVIPGCKALTPLGENHFGLNITLGVASIKGSYDGEVRLYDLVAPTALTMHAAGSGAPGAIDTTVAVKLTDQGDGTTGLEYDADAVVGGMVGGVGQRVLTGVAKKTAAQFFASIDQVLTGERVARPVVVTGEPEVMSPVGRPAVAPPVGGPRRLELLGAAIFGAVSMAIGVVIGARAARGPVGRR